MSVSISAAIRAAARRAPHAPALLCGGEETSYAELMGRVDDLAADLQSRGIGPGCRVVIHLDRSPQLVVAVLATLAVGAAYVPLDVDFPALRLRQIMAHCAPHLVISGLGISAPAAPVFDRVERSQDGPQDDLTPQGTVYLIYTSGSTGEPKGVIVGHRALENYLEWACATLPAGDVPLLSSIAFDLAVTCLYPPLMRGNTLVLLPRLGSGRALAHALLNGRYYGFVKMTPTHFRLLNLDQKAELGRQSGLVMFGGERLPADLVRQVRRDNPTLRVMNHYGPTETTVGCCVHEVPHAEDTLGTIPIGRPIPGLQATVRSRSGEITQDGMIGELWIGGLGLANGYWRMSELSQRAFVKATDTGEYWYRTGDLARRDTCGVLQYHGRIDDQVKVLGHRVEPQEIEIALRTHHAVQDVAVVAEERTSLVRIVAAITAVRPHPSEAELLAHARTLLPPAMVPSRIIVFDRIPLLPSGKTDRFRILAAGDAGIAKSKRTEAMVAGQFARALGLDDIDRTDDFFELGGDSLAAVEIVYWVSRTFHIELEISAMFEYPSIRALTERIEDLLPGGVVDSSQDVTDVRTG